MSENAVDNKQAKEIWDRFDRAPSDDAYRAAILAHAALPDAWHEDFLAVRQQANMRCGSISHALPIQALALANAHAARIAAKKAAKEEKAERLASVTRIRTQVEPFTWVDVSGIFAEPIAEPKWVVPAMEIGPGRPCGLWGLGGGGKSWDAMEIGRAVASGTKAFGFYEVSQGNVSHVSHELGLRAVRERYRRLANGNNMELEDFGDRLRICCLPKLFLNSPGAEDQYCRAFEGQSLVILDSLRRAVPGEDENSSEMSNHLDIMNRVSEKTGASFLVIHHCGKGEVTDKRLSGRGSTAIMDGSGCVWLLEGSGAGPRLMTQIRAHDDGDGECEPFYVEMQRVALPSVSFQASRAPVRLLRLDAAEMGDRLAVSKAKHAVANEQRAEQMVLMLVRDTPGINKGQLEKALVSARILKQKEARGLLEDMARRALIEVIKDGNALAYKLSSSLVDAR